jgi:thymidine phosphorylase
MIALHGGDARVVDEPQRLPRARRKLPVTAASGGYVRDIDALCLGQVATRLGAGRQRAEDRVDPRVGIELSVERGSAVGAGDVLALVHCGSGALDNGLLQRVAGAFRIGASPPRPRARVLERRGPARSPREGSPP